MRQQVTTAVLLFAFVDVTRTLTSSTTAECADRHIFSDRPSAGTLESPAFPTPYRSGLSCLINISTIASNVIHLTFLSFDLAENNRYSGQCLDAYLLVIVVDRLGKEHIGNRLCGTTLPSKIETMQPTVYVQFVTTAPGRHHRGFRLRYEIISEAVIKEPPSYLPDDEKMFEHECGGATKPGQLTGEIVSPGYPDTYPRNATCYWLIRVDPRQRVYIRLAHLHLSSTIAECERASLSIIDGYKHRGNVFKKDLTADASEARFCGSQLYYMEEGMKSYLSSANRLLVRLNTKDRPSISTTGQRVGFKLIWTAVEGLFDENPHSSSALSSSDHKDDSVQFHTCTEFTCQGGQICVEQDQGVCAMRPQLCIHSSLVCNGVQNCVEGDYSDEQHCYSREIIAGSVGGFLGLITVVSICVCCDQWLGVDGDDPSMASKRTLRDCAAHDGIVAAVANLGFLGIWAKMELEVGALAREHREFPCSTVLESWHGNCCCGISKDSFELLAETVIDLYWGYRFGDVAFVRAFKVKDMSAHHSCEHDDRTADH
ncbi:hypothetical protein Y032_0387g456 [Ancylostoma ceylanicum]|uniref:CUB domain-containing protein n=1 Tax=Ancylostoma ceylanicum TaxID=53326 RepID=A0A016RSI1_9BILA|nr:hypothetical protein Y032_0387g456 [Ancylostoma ceylanicum]